MAVGVPWGSQICKRHSSPSDETDRIISDAASGSWGLFHLLSRWREVPLGASAKLAIFGNPMGEVILWIYIYIHIYEFIWGVSRFFSGFAYNNPLKKLEMSLPSSSLKKGESPKVSLTAASAVHLRQKTWFPRIGTTCWMVYNIYILCYIYNIWYIILNGTTPTAFL